MVVRKEPYENQPNHLWIPSHAPLHHTPYNGNTRSTNHHDYPPDLVTMNAVYGTNSYFDMTLSDIPVGYDIINGIYHGWCVQKNMNMTQHVNHTVLLYSSYASAPP